MKAFFLGLFAKTHFFATAIEKCLERDLGFKVNQKLAGFDEEKLVFTLLVNAAKERLYCLFQRSDESGRVLAPSWYLTELRRSLEAPRRGQLVESTIPRSIATRRIAAPFDREDLLLPEELAIRLSLEDRDSTSFIEAFDLSPATVQTRTQSHGTAGSQFERLSDAFDGMISHRHPITGVAFQSAAPRPLALEIYGRCPFQYFARHVLGLERLERPEECMGPSPAEFGELGHLILKLDLSGVDRPWLL